MPEPKSECTPKHVARYIQSRAMQISDPLANPNRIRPNLLTLRVNNGWISTNPTTFGLGVRPFNHSTRQNITLKSTIFTQLEKIPPEPTLQLSIGLESGPNFSNPTSSVRVTPKPDP